MSLYPWVLLLASVAVYAAPSLSDHEQLLTKLSKLSLQATASEEDVTSRLRSYGHFLQAHGDEIHKGNWMGRQVEQAGIHLESLGSIPYNPNMMLNDSACTVADVYPLCGMELDFVAVPGQPAYAREKYNWVGGRIERSDAFPNNMRQVAVYIYTPALPHDVAGLPLQPLKGYNASILASVGIQTGPQGAPLPRNQQFPLEINGNGYGDDHIAEYHDSTFKECKEGAIQAAIPYHPGSATENVFDTHIQTRSKIVQFLVADFIATFQHMWNRSHTLGDRLDNVIDWTVPVMCKGHSIEGLVCECIVSGCPEFGINQPYTQFGVSFTKDSASGWIAANTTMATYNLMRVNLPSEDSAGTMQEWRAREGNANSTLNVNAMYQRWSHQMWQWSLSKWVQLMMLTGDWINGFGWAIPGYTPVLWLANPPHNGWVLGTQPLHIQDGFNTYMELSKRLRDALKQGPSTVQQQFMTSTLTATARQRGWPTYIFIGHGGNELVTDFGGVNPPPPGIYPTCVLLVDGEYMYDYNSASVASSSMVTSSFSGPVAFEGKTPLRQSTILPGMRTWVVDYVKPNGFIGKRHYQPSDAEMGL